MRWSVRSSNVMETTSMGRTMDKVLNVNMAFFFFVYKSTDWAGLGSV